MNCKPKYWYQVTVPGFPSIEVLGTGITCFDGQTRIFDEEELVAVVPKEGCVSRARLYVGQ